MPITSNTYNPRSGEMVFTISAAEGAEELKLAVTPKDRNRSQLTFWQDDGHDANSFLVVQSDPIRLEYEDDREDFYRIVETVFDPETGEEVEEFTRYLCKRCAAKSEGRCDWQCPLTY